MVNTTASNDVDGPFLRGLGFTENEKGRYQTKLGNDLLELEIVGEPQVLGVNVEIRLNNEFVETGYWDSQLDFITTLRQRGIR